MKILCLFRPCRYRHLFDVPTTPRRLGAFGVYQCVSCKTVSVGASRDVSTKPLPLRKPRDVTPGREDVTHAD